MTNVWQPEEGQRGLKLTANSEYSVSSMGGVEPESVAELELNYWKGFVGEDLRFLRDFVNLQCLDISSPLVKDDSPIHQCLSLRVLAVDTHSKEELRFDELPNLEELWLEPWRAKAKSLYQCKGLTKLGVYRWNDDVDLRSFWELKALKSFTLKNATRLVSLKGVEELESLRHLWIGLAPRLQDLSGLESLSGLRELELDTCKKVRDINPVAGLSQLVKFNLDNCGDIETLMPIRSLRRLEEFTFIESTNIVDGDLSHLSALPSLKWRYYKERKHYRGGPGSLH